MSDRVRIRVTMHGTEARRTLTVADRDICDLSFYEVLDLISELSDMIRSGAGRKSDYTLGIAGQEIDLSFIEVVGLLGNASSTLRW